MSSIVTLNCKETGKPGPCKTKAELTTEYTSAFDAADSATKAASVEHKTGKYGDLTAKAIEAHRHAGKLAKKLGKSQRVNFHNNIRKTFEGYMKPTTNSTLIRVTLNCKATGKPGKCKGQTKGSTTGSVAMSASDRAFATGSSSDHAYAATKHQQAAEHHRKSGNTTEADKHEKAFKSHLQMSQSRKPTTNSTGEGPMTKRERQTLINELVTNGCGCWTEEDREILRAFEPERLRNLVANAKTNATNEATLNTLKEKFGVDEFTDEIIANMAVQTDDDADDDDDVTTNCDTDMDTEDMTKKKKGKKVMPTMNSQPKTTQEWLQDAPDEVKAVFNSAIEVNNAAKTDLVTRLVANAAAGDKKTLTDMFMTKSLAELKLLVKALPAPTTNRSQGTQEQPKNRLSVAYFGGQSAGEPTTNSVLPDNDFDKDDFLPIPKLTFGSN